MRPTEMENRIYPTRLLLLLSLALTLIHKPLSFCLSHTLTHTCYRVLSCSHTISCPQVLIHIYPHAHALLSKMALWLQGLELNLYLLLACLHKCLRTWPLRCAALSERFGKHSPPVSFLVVPLPALRIHLDVKCWQSIWVSCLNWLCTVCLSSASKPEFP